MSHSFGAGSGRPNSSTMIGMIWPEGCLTVSTFIVWITSHEKLSLYSELAEFYLAELLTLKARKKTAPFLYRIEAV